MSIADPNKTIPDGREPVHPPEPQGRRSELDRCELLADHLFAGGPGHVLYLKSELTEAALAHLFRQHRDGALAADDRAGHAAMPNSSTTAIPCVDATFSKSGDPRYFWTETIKSYGEDISPHLVRHRRAGSLIHTQPNQLPNRRYSGVCTRIDTGARHAPVRNGAEAKESPGRASARGSVLSTSACAFPES